MEDSGDGTENHPETLTVRGNMASFGGNLGREREALAIHERLLNVRSRVLGRHHRETLSSKNNLAYWAARIGDLSRARALWADVLEEGSRRAPA